MSRFEPGLLGASSFPEPVVLIGSFGEIWISRVTVRMVLVPVIEASSLMVGGLVVASEWPCLMSMGLVELEPEPVVVVVELGLVRLLEPVGLVPLVSDPACQPTVSSIPGCQWDLRSVACSFPIVKRSSRIFFLQM